VCVLDTIHDQKWSLSRDILVSLPRRVMSCVDHLLYADIYGQRCPAEDEEYWDSRCAACGKDAAVCQRSWFHMQLSRAGSDGMCTRVVAWGYRLLLNTARAMRGEVAGL